MRLDDGAALVAEDTNVRRSVERYLKQYRGQREYLDVVSQLQPLDQTDDLLEFLKPDVAASLQVAAVRLLVKSKETELFKRRLAIGDAASVAIADALGLIGEAESFAILKPLVTAELPFSQFQPPTRMKRQHALATWHR